VKGRKFEPARATWGNLYSITLLQSQAFSELAPENPTQLSKPAKCAISKITTRKPKTLTIASEETTRNMASIRN